MVAKELGRFLVCITVILLISITLLTLHPTTTTNPRMEEECSSICKTPYLPDIDIKHFHNQQPSRNGSSNDTEPPRADPGTYSPIYKGRFVEFDASGSMDNFPGLLENGTFNWSFYHYGDILLEGVRAKFRFTVSGPYMISLEVTDAAGNKNINSTTIEVIEDIKGPTMNRTITYPGNNEVEVDLNVTPRIIFDDPGEFTPIIDDSTIDGNVSMFVHDSGMEVNLSLELSEDGKVLTLIPDKDLMKDRIYTITIGKNITDMAGNHLTGAEEFSFKTMESFRRERLEIEPDVPRGGDVVMISLFFNNNIDETSMTPEFFSLTGPGGQIPLYLHFKKDKDDKENRSIVIVNIVPPVEYGAEYSLSISELIVDESGSQLGENPSYSFNTEKLKKVDGETPLFFYFLVVLLVAGVFLAIYVVAERVKLRNSAGYSAANEQLKNRKKQMRELKRMDREEMKKKKRAKDGTKGGGEVSMRESGDELFEPLGRGRKQAREDSRESERFAPRRRSTKTEPGKVSYYHPREISSFDGKTYDVDRISDHGERRRRERQQPSGWDSGRRGGRPGRGGSSGDKRRSRGGGMDRRRPQSRKNSMDDVDWG